GDTLIRRPASRLDAPGDASIVPRISRRFSKIDEPGQSTRVPTSSKFNNWKSRIETRGCPGRHLNLRSVTRCRLFRFAPFVTLAVLLGCQELGLQRELPPTSSGPSTAPLLEDPNLKHWRVASNNEAGSTTSASEAAIGPPPTGRNSPLSRPI